MASKLVDWSLIDVQLYNFHTVGASIIVWSCGGPGSGPFAAEPRCSQYVQDCM